MSKKAMGLSVVIFKVGVLRHDQERGGKNKVWFAHDATGI